MKRMRCPGRIMLGLLLTAGLLGVGLLALRPDLRYLAGDMLTRWSRSAPLEKIDQEELLLTEFTLEALRSRADVEENRNLMLINPEHPISEAFQPQLDADGVMDETMAEDYAALAGQIKERFGERLIIRSGYRTREEQENTIQQDGEIAASLDASEHQAGLALDVCVPGYGGRALLKTAAGRYLNDSCWAYGFIIRYPYYGTEDTGIGYEPWHLRYVGSPHARIMMENSWTLEEYFRRLEPGVFYRSSDVLITRQAGETFRLPEGWRSLSMSPDNQGYWVFTLTMETE
ncbi:MAG: D-alanyl-D-alanine carboxypeptidase family protein [Candidatus Onthomonas sp.]